MLSVKRLLKAEVKVVVVTVLRRTGTPNWVTTLVAVVVPLPKFPRSM
jgi:hypothetical protein